MATQYTLFTEVRPFYANLLSALAAAEREISMMYFTFDHGVWSSAIGRVLRERRASGVRVRLMVDEVGLAVDAPENALRNRKLLRGLAAAGVEVHIFRPAGQRLTQLNRLHFKVCAVDRRVAFIGGSNVGDHYLHWNDCNLRLDGELGDTLHRLYDYIHQFSQRHRSDQELTRSRCTAARISDLWVGDARLLLTLPGRRSDVRRALLSLILDANSSVAIRNWYFLPDKELLNALRSQAELGVSVRILHSHRTRVRPIDSANYVHGHKLTQSGAEVYRYIGRYMHAKVTWNDRDEVIFGSANLDKAALHNNFECCLAIRNSRLARDLARAFESDVRSSAVVVTPTTLPGRSFSRQMLSYACAVASPWL